jgi:biopolymer transport protein TolR
MKGDTKMTKPQINVTPLIDVLLVLLIIFMVITPIKPSSFEAKIPSESKNDGALPDPRTLVVAINPDSTLRLNHENTISTVEDPEIMIKKLAEIFRLRTENMAFASGTENDPEPRIEKTVFIKASHSASYGSVAKVVDAVKMSGAYPIGLQIDDLE